MAGEVLGIGFGVGAQDGNEAIVETKPPVVSLIGQHRAKGNVQDFAGVEIIQQQWQVLILGQTIFSDGETGSNLVDFCRDVITGFVDGVALERIKINLAEEFNINSGDGAQGLEVAGAGGLEMRLFSRKPGRDWINAEFVRAGVQAKLISAEAAGDRRVTGEIRFEFFKAADIIDAFFETPNIARRKADPNPRRAAPARWRCRYARRAK